MHNGLRKNLKVYNTKKMINDLITSLSSIYKPILKKVKMLSKTHLLKTTIAQMRLGNSAVNGHGMPNNIGQNIIIVLNRYTGNDKVSNIP